MIDIKLVLELHIKWLRGEKDGERADLRYADLGGANLTGANLTGADLRGANLRYADLRDADLRDTDLRYANLRYANLGGANLTGANLTGADLRDTDLRYANLGDADLRDVNLDFSTWPLWCGSLTAKVDDRQVKQLLYHTLSVAKNSDNVSQELKAELLTERNLSIALEFHRANECNKLQGG